MDLGGVKSASARERRKVISEGVIDMPKRTWQPKVRKRLRTHGFRKRMQKPGGRNVIKRRRLKNRTNLSVKLTTRKRVY